MKNISTAQLNTIADKALYVATSTMLLFFASFIWISIQASTAAAQASPVCKGIDLIAQYESEQPDVLAKMQEEAAKTENGNSIFWKVEKAGIEPSWLLGTMHMADERIAKLEGERLNAFNGAKTVIVESTDVLDPAKAQAAMAKLTHLTFLKPGEDLSDLIGAQATEKLKPIIAARGMPFAVASKLKPWVVATSIALPVCELVAKASGKPILDNLIAKKALQDGKTLVGLETIEEQITAMATLPQEFHVTALIESLELGDEMENVMETMKQLYIKGDISMVMPLMKSISPKTEANSGNAQFQEQLILKRNIIMAERASKHFENGSAFLAVGALHIPGETGLVTLLREQGYTVTAQ